MRLIWATDVHFDHVDAPAPASDFARMLLREHGDAAGLILSGDIAEAATVDGFLTSLAEAWGRPVYFVLGNHDYYGSTFAQKDREMEQLTREHPRLSWLDRGPVWLSEGVLLAGVGGFYDAAHGDPSRGVVLRDFRKIGDLFEAEDQSRARLVEVCAERSAHAVEMLLAQLGSEAGLKAQVVVIVTHVPPFAECVGRRGAAFESPLLPFYSCRRMGDALRTWAARHPEQKFLVLCGHTHMPTRFLVTENLTVCSGEAAYGSCRASAVLHLRDDGCHLEPRLGSVPREVIATKY